MWREGSLSGCTFYLQDRPLHAPHDRQGRTEVLECTLLHRQWWHPDMNEMFNISTYQLIVHTCACTINKRPNSFFTESALIYLLITLFKYLFIPFTHLFSSCLNIYSFFYPSFFFLFKLIVCDLLSVTRIDWPVIWIRYTYLIKLNALYWLTKNYIKFLKIGNLESNNICFTHCYL